MDLNAYQKGALFTAQYGTKTERGLIYTVLGLAGEAGEVANKMKKVLRGDYGLDQLREVLAHELGDVLWYVATVAHELGYTLEEIGEMNLDKLRARNVRGTVKGSGDER